MILSNNVKLKVELFYQIDKSKQKNPYLRKKNQEAIEEKDSDILFHKLDFKIIMFVLQYLDVKQQLIFTQLSRRWRRILSISIENKLDDIYQQRLNILNFFISLNAKKSFNQLFMRDIQRKSEIIQIIPELQQVNQKQIIQFLENFSNCYSEYDPNQSLNYSKEQEMTDIFTLLVMFNILEIYDHRKFAAKQIIQIVKSNIEKITSVLNDFKYKNIQPKIYVYDRIAEFFDGFIYSTLQTSLKINPLQTRVLMWVSVQCFYHIYQIYSFDYLFNYATLDKKIEEFGLQYQCYNKLQDKFSQVLTFLPKNVDLLSKLNKNNIHHILSYLDLKDQLKMKQLKRFFRGFIDNYHIKIVEELSLKLDNYSDIYANLMPQQKNELEYFQVFYKKVPKFNLSHLIVYKSYSNIPEEITNIICTAGNMIMIQENYSQKQFQSMTQLIEYDGRKLSTTYLRDQFLLEIMVKYIKNQRLINISLLDKQTAQKLQGLILQYSKQIQNLQESENYPLLWIFMNYISSKYSAGFMKTFLEFTHIRQQVQIFHQKKIQL